MAAGGEHTRGVAAGGEHMRGVAAGGERALDYAAEWLRRDPSNESWHDDERRRLWLSRLDGDGRRQVRASQSLCQVSSAFSVASSQTGCVLCHICARIYVYYSYYSTRPPKVT